MPKKLILTLLLLVFGLSVSAQGITIIWVSDDKGTDGTDQGWIDMLVANGYTVNLDFRSQEGRTLDTAEIAALDAADLVIFSRDTSSGDYNGATEIAQWNGITTPLICLSAYQYRSSRWKWMNSTSTSTTTAPLLAVMPEHPIFDGVNLDGNNQVAILTAQSNVGNDNVDPANNYTLIATRSDSGVEFYPGSGQSAGGPRMYFAAGGSEGNNVDGRYNLTAEGEKVFLNAVAYYTGPKHTASNPDPGDGENVPPQDEVEGGVYMLLRFDPGDDAIAHTAYFSDVYEDVFNRVEDVNLGPPPYPVYMPTGYYVGLDDANLPAFAREPLATSVTYYWAVDEFNGPEEAWDPSPADGASFVAVEPDLTLSWKLGDLVVTGYDANYVVYWGTDEATVEAATTGGILATIEAASTVLTGLPAETEVFWRVDTNRMKQQFPFPTYTTKGVVWSFTTLPVVSVTDPNLIGWWKLDGDFGDLVFDHSGQANHGTAQGFDFDGSNDFVELPTGMTTSDWGTIAMWMKSAQDGRGMMFYASDGTAGDGYGGQNELHVNMDDGGDAVLYIESDGNNVNIGSPPVNDDEWHHIAATWDSLGESVLYVDGIRAASTTNAGNVFAFSGRTRLGRPNDSTRYYDGLLDDVRLYDYAIPANEIKILAGCLAASGPDPANGEIDVSTTPTLSWETGAFVAGSNGNILYFAEDMDQVSDRTVAGIPLTDPCYAVPGTLDLGGTYYWAVDTVNGVETWPGDIWSFTTVNYLDVDDMETYTYWKVADNNIFEVWVDGMGDCKGSGNGTGANVFESLTTGVGGSQAMEFNYDNDGMVENPCLVIPVDQSRDHYYSKAEAEIGNLPSGIGSDWTAQGVKALSLQFFGGAANVKEPMWIELTDVFSNKAKVTYGYYDDEDPNAMLEESWHEWLISLADFTGVTLSNVKSIAIGVGTEGSAVAGGSGRVYFDDVRLYAPRCVLTRRSADFTAFDYVADCRIDYQELAAMTSRWLTGEAAEVSWAPSSGWSSVDIGDTATSGSFVDNGDGSYTVTGSGGDIWGTADAFHYAFRQLTGDGQMTVNVVSITGTSTNAWQKAGVMIRETLDPGSRNAMMEMSAGGASSNFDGGDSFQRRLETDGGSSSSHVVGDNVEILTPACVRIVRNGDKFSGFIYVNGEWVQEGPTVMIDMPETVYIGLAVTSHDNAAGIYSTVTFNSACDSSFGGLLPDLAKDNLINFVDYAVLMSRWLEEQLYP